MDRLILGTYLLREKSIYNENGIETLLREEDRSAQLSKKVHKKEWFAVLDIASAAKKIEKY